MPIDRKALSDAAWARLQTVPNATHYKGLAVNVPILADDDHLAPYTVLYPGAGTPDLEDDLADTAEGLDWLIQITCVAGYIDDLMGLVSRVDAAFYRWTPVVDGLVCGVMRPPTGYDPGPAPLDRNVNPPRPFLPLQYRCTVTAT